jgi:hypothetical protein
MRPGGGKAKGTAFERKVCKDLSLWVSHGSDPDLFWRSAISGGRATVLLKGGRSIKPAGDICAVDPAGHKLTDRYFIECKHDRNLELSRFLCHTGKLWKFWEKAVQQAVDHRRSPMLIARQNNFPILLLVYVGKLRKPYPLAELGACAVYRFQDVMHTECKL